MKAVADSGPLIALAKVIIPQAIYRENEEI